MFHMKIVKREKIESQRKIRGLGDVVHLVAGPIATVIKHDCGGRCDKWRDALNRLFRKREADR